MNYFCRPGGWNDCGATAEKFDDDGNVILSLTCCLEAHADPQDGTAMHRDPDGIWWSVRIGDYDD